MLIMRKRMISYHVLTRIKVSNQPELVGSKTNYGANLFTSNSLIMPISNFKIHQKMEKERKKLNLDKTNVAKLTDLNKIKGGGGDSHHCTTAICEFKKLFGLIK
ncbi:hypothetical protein [Aquimarina rubra]|uniref:Uncharacterized protein n=1 Tax=Aquimarina rubra TaxID=1920033 RepID=A0ABW5L9Y7_9FLAO